MKHAITFAMAMLFGSTVCMAQFISGRQIAKDDNTGLWYVTTINGEIWEDDGNGGFNYVPGQDAGGNSGDMVIANGKLYIVRIDQVKVYHLQPQVQLDTTWEVSASNWLLGLCWDGNNTLYCHDQAEIFQVDMTTGAAMSIFGGLSNLGEEYGMEYDPVDDRLVILKRTFGGQNPIMGYNLQSGNYVTLITTDLLLEDITLGCDDQWTVSGGWIPPGGQGIHGVLYNFPRNFSHAGDTLLGQIDEPRGVYYDAADDQVAWLNHVTDAVQFQGHPCTLFSGIDGLDNPTAPLFIAPAHGGLFVRWDRASRNAGPVELTVHSVSGRIVHQLPVKAEALANGYHLVLPALASGAYIISASTPAERVAAEWVIP